MNNRKKVQLLCATIAVLLAMLPTFAAAQPAEKEPDGNPEGERITEVHYLTGPFEEQNDLDSNMGYVMGKNVDKYLKTKGYVAKSSWSITQASFEALLEDEHTVAVVFAGHGSSVDDGTVESHMVCLPSDKLSVTPFELLLDEMPLLGVWACCCYSGGSVHDPEMKSFLSRQSQIVGNGYLKTYKDESVYPLLELLYGPIEGLANSLPNLAPKTR